MTENHSRVDGIWKTKAGRSRKEVAKLVYVSPFLFGDFRSFQHHNMPDFFGQGTVSGIPSTEPLLPPNRGAIFSPRELVVTIGRYPQGP